MTLRELIARDGEICVWCGRTMWPADLTAEHLMPRARGGRGTPENLAVACRRCNRRRRTRPVAAYVRERERERVGEASERERVGEASARERIEAALRRLADSSSPTHAAYGRRELELLFRATSGSKGR